MNKISKNGILDISQNKFLAVFSQFLSNTLSAVTNEQCERFHQDISEMELRYYVQFNPNMMTHDQNMNMSQTLLAINSEIKRAFYIYSGISHHHPNFP